MNNQMTINVKVQGLEHLRETVALLKELKELGAGNTDDLSEIISGGAVLPKVSVEVEEDKPWYPDSGAWIEHDGKSVPDGNRFRLLLRHERETKEYDDFGWSLLDNWTDEFSWNSCKENDVVAYQVLED